MAENAGSRIVRPEGCICVEFRDTGGFRIADLCCPVHGVGGSDPGDGPWEKRTERRMPIGYDIDLLCDAVTLVVRKPHLTSQRTIQRYVRVGFVKAQRLLLLMDDYGITNGQPHSRWESRMVLVKPASLPVTLARLREVAAREGVPVEGSEDA